MISLLSPYRPRCHPDRRLLLLSSWLEFLRHVHGHHNRGGQSPTPAAAANPVVAVASSGSSPPRCRHRYHCHYHGHRCRAPCRCHRVRDGRGRVVSTQPPSLRVVGVAAAAVVEPPRHGPSQ
ncbi:hypothetical protein EDB85DRAFT_2276607 [Lactarius pseudohatsudake]|nr:hypothetical protein EDB85DRAFT_2276607 [Lactarius pseudohatsudake]